MSLRGRSAATYWASATVSFQNLAVRLSFSFGPLGENGALFCDNLLLGEREEGNHRTDPMHQGGNPSPLLLLGTELISLSSLFAEMKIIAAVARSPFSSFFITHPLIFGWLSLGLKRESKSPPGSGSAAAEFDPLL